MAGLPAIISQKLRPKTDALLQDLKDKRNPDYFPVDGLNLFVGRQGAGKTISLVNATLILHEAYPKSILCSNVEFFDLRKVTFTDEDDLRQKMQSFDTEKDYVFYQSSDEFRIVMTKINNKKYGVIIVCDEIHTYYNALASNKIPMWAFREISQQRKQRKTILASSQEYMRVAKAFREQCAHIAMCETFFGILTFQRVYRGGKDFNVDEEGNVKKSKLAKLGFFWHTQDLREAYDTYQKVESGEDSYQQDIVVKHNDDRQAGARRGLLSRQR